MGDVSLMVLWVKRPSMAGWWEKDDYRFAVELSVARMLL